MNNIIMENIFNIHHINSSKTSIARVLLIFYLLVASNYTDNLMAKQMKEYLNSNRLVQHFIGFLTLIVLVTMVGGITESRTALIYSLIGYIWFIFSTKLDIYWNIIILILLFIGYMYENSLIVKEKQILDDPNLTDKQKVDIIDRCNIYKTWIVGSIMTVTLLGTIMYTNKKKVQYGGGYDLFTYMFY
jgi:hypothetical protein